MGPVALYPTEMEYTLSPPTSAWAMNAPMAVS